MSVLKTYGSDTYSYKPSTTYKISNNRIEGMIDGIAAVEQAAKLALSIERFEHIIYSHDYGVELVGLIGKPREYVKGEIQRRIVECLKEDDRIESITDFKLSLEGECAFVSFQVISIFGEFHMERSVKIGK